jgi:two-component system NtrC family sensor kinase
MPVNRLIQASERVSGGDLSPDIGPVSGSEIGVLQSTFLSMVESLRTREEQERRQSESRLMQSEKQASVGRLAAGVAHEINNPLTAVLTYAHLLLDRDDLDEETRADVATIAEATERVRVIVRGLLDFSRQSEMNLETSDVNSVARAAIDLVENQALVKGVALRFEPAEGIPCCRLDRSQMQSVIINMVINAVDATDAGGTITVATGVTISTGEPDRKGVEISVADTGRGIPPENLEKIFDPFFTTKDVGRGTGLGLAVSHGIVSRHGGSIRVRSKPGEGSVFTIWLPVEDGDIHEDTGC